MLVELKAWLKKHWILYVLARGVRDLFALVLWPFRTPGFLASLAVLTWFRCWGWRRIPKTGGADNDRLIVMLGIVNLPCDPRVQREAQALAANGFLVKVVCPVWDPRPTIPDWGPRISFQVAPHSAGQYSYRLPRVFGWQLFRAALQEPAWAYHAHDLNTALPALLAAAIKRVPCVCDFHEWFSENVSYNAYTRTYRPHGWLLRTVYRKTERLALRAASRVVTVCDSIAELLEREFRSPQKVVVVRNIPLFTNTDEAKPSVDLRSTLQVPPGKKIVMYQGGVGPSRNLEPIIQAMGQVDSAVLVIRGPGIDVFGPAYLRLAKKIGAATRVFCLPPVSSNAVVREAKGADIGVWSLLANVGLNFKLALPNKIFEYLRAGIPILVADLPEATKLVKRYEVGVCFDPDDPSSIARAIRRLSDDEDYYRRCQERIADALDDLRADKEWLKLVAIYENMRPQMARFSARAA
jgi:glycosyltransferase involved in cell wall biosynthesis